MYLQLSLGCCAGVLASSFARSFILHWAVVVLLTWLFAWDGFAELPNTGNSSSSGLGLTGVAEDGGFTATGTLREVSL